MIPPYLTPGDTPSRMCPPSFTLLPDGKISDRKTTLRNKQSQDELKIKELQNLGLTFLHKIIQVARDVEGATHSNAPVEYFKYPYLTLTIEADRMIDGCTAALEVAHNQRRFRNESFQGPTGTSDLHPWSSRLQSSSPLTKDKGTGKDRPSLHTWSKERGCFYSYILNLEDESSHKVCTHRLVDWIYDRTPLRLARIPVVIICSTFSCNWTFKMQNDTSYQELVDNMPVTGKCRAEARNMA